jgi:Mg2+/Co2+ transporter CorC
VSTRVFYDHAILILVLRVQGALDMSRKTAEAAMTPLNKVFMLSSESVLDEATLQSVLASGHSRIPVYERRNRCPPMLPAKVSKGAARLS